MSSDECKAYCKYCKCEIHAHRNDLLSHAFAAKHVKPNVMHSQWININVYNWAGFGLVFVTDWAEKKNLATLIFSAFKKTMSY